MVNTSRQTSLRKDRGIRRRAPPHPVVAPLRTMSSNVSLILARGQFNRPEGPARRGQALYHLQRHAELMSSSAMGGSSGAATTVGCSQTAHGTLRADDSSTHRLIFREHSLILSSAPDLGCPRHWAPELPGCTPFLKSPSCHTRSPTATTRLRSLSSASSRVSLHCQVRPRPPRHPAVLQAPCPS